MWKTSKTLYFRRKNDVYNFVDNTRSYTHLNFSYVDILVINKKFTGNSQVTVDN